MPLIEREEIAVPMVGPVVAPDEPSGDQPTNGVAEVRVCDVLALWEVVDCDRAEDSDLVKTFVTAPVPKKRAR